MVTESAKPLPPPVENDYVRTVFAGMASVCAGSFTHPIDTVKVRLQVQGEYGQDSRAMSAKAYNNLFRGARVVVEHEGLRGLYKGLSASCLRESTYSTIRLGLYEPLKRVLGATDPSHTPIWKKFAAAAMSGLLGSALANPTDLLKIRMQAWEGHPHGLFWHARQVIHSRGFLGFYRGLIPTMVRAAILNSTKLATYDHIKHTILNFDVMNDGKPLHFVSSVCAGICMASTTAPFDIAKTRIMNQAPDHKIYKGLVDCIVKVVRHEGLFALYRGFTPQWLRFGPFTIVQLMVWEELRKLYGMRGV